MRRAEVEIGDGNGRIALYCNYSTAMAMMDAFPYPDLAYDEMLRAVRRAYPEQAHNDKLCDDYCDYCEMESGRDST